MATTDTRTGFRLPWSSERPHAVEPVEPATGDAGQPVDERAGAAAEPVVETLGEAFDDGTEQTADDVLLLDTADINARLGLRPSPPRQAAAKPKADRASQEPSMIAPAPSPVRAPIAPRKPSKLMADLATAIRATAEAARVQALEQVDVDAAAAVADIRNGAKDGEAALRVASEEDIAGIREWSKAEIARIKEATEAKIEARKAALGDELAAHAAETDRSAGAIEAMAAAYREEMAAYTERLLQESDPARLATMAETMPEPPAFVAGPEDAVADDEPELVEDHADAEVEAVAEVEADDRAEAAAEGVVGVAAESEANAQPVDVAEAEAPETPAPMRWGAAQAPVADASAFGIRPSARAFGMTEDPSGWAANVPVVATAVATAEVEEDDASSMDRGAIMAALEAAAEAVVAAEAGAESVDHADAGEPATATAGVADDRDPWADAAFSARLAAAGFDTDPFQGRIAGLAPDRDNDAGDLSPAQVTTVAVSGLVSVASIASFKRHLGRLQGVQAVAVASGPEGEFVFTVTHREDASFRDAISSLPGFAARVTSVGDGVVAVTARDPETEG